MIMPDNDYTSEFQSWDWEGYRHDCVQSATSKVFDYSIEELTQSDDLVDDSGNIIGRAFIGTVFTLTPSGKYYMPWACSNLEVCGNCNGQGCDECGHIGSMEAYQDELWAEALDRVCHEHGFWAEGGEGCPTDLFVARWVSQAEIVTYALESLVSVVKSWLDGKATISEVKEMLANVRVILNKLGQIGDE
jgi:hypothetical protein